MKSLLVIPFVVTSMFLSCVDAENGTNQSKPPGERVVHFPKDRSLGRVHILDWNAQFWGFKEPHEKKLEQAKGDVVVPARKDLFLLFSDSQQSENKAVDLSPLDQLGPTDLQGLGIPFTSISADEVKRLLRHKSLRYLSLGPLSKVTDDSIAPLAKMTWLEVLILPETDVSDKGLWHLRKLTNLKKLTLYGTDVTDQGLVYLKGLNQLKDLQLGFTKVTDRGLQHLAGLEDLERLDLWNTDVRGSGLVHLKQMSELKTLNLMETGTTNTDLIHLESLTSLNRLDLSGTQVDDDGLVHLHKLSNLKTLLLARTKVTDVGVNKLKQILTDCEIYKP